jgi:threonine/homoserine/homoserine lactone efflux protein
MIPLFYFVRGIAIGFTMAAPVGPIALLCIKHGLNYGFWSAIFSGLGAAFADFIYACVATYGLTYVSSFLLEHNKLLRIVGGLFIAYLGYQVYKTEPQRKQTDTVGTGLLQTFIATFFLTITNPITLLAFAALFTTFGIKELTTSDASLLAAGVFAGSALWWLILSTCASLLRARITPKFLRRVNKISGVIIILISIVTLGSIFFPFVDHWLSFVPSP